jgi:adenylylsulfate kinase-like enzyme
VAGLAIASPKLAFDGTREKHKMNRFVAVTGLPASGKSTVGAAAATALRLPLFDKDVILEVLFESLGVGDGEWRMRLSRAADEVLRGQVVSSHGAVIVSWWCHPFSEVPSGTPTEWLSSLPGALIELHCKCSPETAAERFLARKRHAGHLDSSKSHAEILASFERFAVHGPLGFGRVVEVDTELPLDPGALLDRLDLSPETGS